MAPLPRCPKLWHFARVTALGWCPQNGWTPLGIAAFKKHRGVCLALLESGAKLELVPHVSAGGLPGAGVLYPGRCRGVRVPVRAAPLLLTQSLPGPSDPHP